LGNICRSPLAEGILHYKSDAAGAGLEVDSAGTSSWHQGELPDPRSIEVAQRNGLDITSQRSRPIKQDDIDHFDLILCMDRSNLNNVLDLCETEEQRQKVVLILDYLEGESVEEVPDPYWGGGFDYVFDLLDQACQSLLDRIK
jgi:protein-tyrosine phosphatase